MIDENDYQMGMKRLGRIVEQNRSVHEADDRWCVNECRLCGYVWNAENGGERPKVCPMCRSSLWDREDAKKVRCHRCGHEWITSSGRDPVMCPSCKSRRWKRKKLPIICNRCGERWNDQLKDGETVCCPVCGPLGPGEYRLGKTRRRSLKDVANPERTGMELTEDMLRDMWKEDEDLFRVVRLRNSGLTSDQADIIVRFDRGTMVPDIAIQMSMSVSAVMDVVLPYMALCESMGVRSWS